MNSPLLPFKLTATLRCGWKPSCAVLLSLLLLADMGVPPVLAGPLEWLKAKRPSSRQAERAPEPAATNTGGRQGLPDFFAGQESGPELTGVGMNPLKFAEAHWLHAKNALVKATKAIQAKIPEKKCSDLVAKLFVVDVQTYREVLKTSSTGILAINGGLRGIEGSITELNGIVTAPREETLDNLEKTLSSIQTQNGDLTSKVKSYLAGVDGMIGLSQEAYQTLELIPNLSLPPIDLYVQSSKQVMRLAQSSAEALKGLLFNIQTGSEEIAASVEMMVTTVRTTLRFSDHFAFRQFPLVNLPLPTREKLFSQVATLKNSAKGIRNTLSIGDSHLKNSAQQFTHLTQGMVAKITDSLKYQGTSEYGVENLPQISGYSHNQICGLYQRVKEGIAEMRVAMGKAGRSSGSGKTSPAIAIESEDQFLSRKAQVANGKLPLFLLGGGAPSSKQVAEEDFKPLRKETGGEMKVLYSEGEPPASVRENLLPDEIDILQQELGSLIPGASDSKSSAASEDEGVTFRAGRKNRQDLVPSGYGTGTEDSALAQAAIPADRDESKNTDLLRMESSPTEGENGDLLPMFRLEDFSPPPEKE